jgi:imidazolonepropionase-like amidohydrolase
MLLFAFATSALGQGPNPLSSGVALKNIRIIDGTGRPASQNQTLLIDGGRIRAIGSTAEIKIPEGMQTLDLPGRTVLPGLVMLHEHLGHPAQFSPPLYLAFGVTTLRTAGTEHPYVELNLKRRIDSGKMPGPELHLTSPFLNGESSPFLADKIVRNTEDARRAVRYWAAEGFTSFKVYQDISKDALAAIIDEAHRLGLPVTAHLKSVSCREAVELGIDNLEHAFGPCTNLTNENLGTDPAGPRAQSLIRLLIERNVVLTFTPIIGNRSLSNDQLELLSPNRRQRYLEEQQAPPPPRGNTPLRPLTLEFARAGGRLVLGSDPYCCGAGRIPGLTNHDAIKRAVEIGFSPLETIRMATIDGATFLGIADRTGTIAIGKEADLIVVKGSPDRNIEDIDNVEMVFANGIRYDPQTLLSSVKGKVGSQ